MAQEQLPGFENFLRRTFQRTLDSIADFCIARGITANMVTLAGLVGNIIAAVLVGAGHLTWGGVVAMLMGPLDAVDGALARRQGRQTSFGAFLDSVTDRYDELLLFGGLLYYFFMVGNHAGIMLTYAAAAGAVLVSYTRARAEALGFEAKVGILSRVERYLILIPGLLFHIPLISVSIIAVLGNLTALQRLFHVRKQAKQQAPQD
jgi:CDP-diacylglycerol--glycerol-3-phosphate 3-phosphatidyltransferase